MEQQFDIFNTRFKIMPYGSTMSGFANKYSDLDLCLIDTEASAYTKNDSKDPFVLWRKEAFKVLGQLYSALSPNGRINWNAKHQHSKSIISGMHNVINI